MPCYQVNTISVELQAADPALLEDALKVLGLPFVRETSSLRINAPGGPIELAGGRATAPRQALPTLNRIRRQYSRQVIQAAARKYRWSMSWKTQDRLVMRRY